MTLRFRSPGRINLIGEHTDYNDGFVLPAAIDRGISFEISPQLESRMAHFSSETLGTSFSVNLEDITPGTGWENYFLGVLHQLALKGIKLPGFSCSISSDLPVGAGLSSSAALECGLAWGLNELFQFGLTSQEIIKISQAAEHTYVGTLCGIMDQFACVMGKPNHFILLDCRSLAHTYISADLGDYSLLLLNSGVSHNLASSAYNARRLACLEGVKLLSAKYPEVHSLRDATVEMLTSLKDKMPQNVYRRCDYVIRENDRVLQAVKALESRNINQVGALLSETHRGLREDYEVSCPELDFLVDQAANFQGVLGARLVGGGFGGCTLNLVRKSELEGFKNHMANLYREAFDLELVPIDVGIGSGVGTPIS